MLNNFRITTFRMKSFDWVSIISILIIFILFIQLSQNLSSPNFWFDESGQFWLALGQNHYSVSNSMLGSFRDIWENSKQHNLDPGGFTILLRFMVNFFDTSPFALRTLPFLFSILACFGLIVWGRYLGISIAASSCAICFLFLNKNFLYYSLELRAYSMEFCGVIILFLCSVIILQSNYRFKILPWNFALIFFGSSRYGFIVYEFAALFSVIAIYVILGKSILSRNVVLMLFGLVVFNLFVYVAMLRFQSPAASPPEYITNLLLYKKNIYEIGAILKVNFLSIFAAPKTLFLALYLLFSSRLKIRESMIDRSLGLLFFFIVFATFFSMILSFLGKMPWMEGSRWSYSELALSSLSLVGSIYLMKLAFKNLRSIQGVLIAGIMIFQTLTAFSLTQYQRGDLEYQNIFKSLNFIANLSPNGGVMVVQKNLWPSYRYLTENSYLPFPFLKNFKVKVIDFNGPQQVVDISRNLALPIHFIHEVPWGESAYDFSSQKFDDNIRIESYPIDSFNHLYVTSVSPR